MMTNQSKPFGSVKTTWELRTYDVWGNAKDGYEVNDSYSSGTVTFYAAQTKHNVGTPYEFVSAALTNRQIKQAFSVNCRIDVDGDDIHYYVNRQRDGYPLGEMECTSHKSLSPVRRSE